MGYFRVPAQLSNPSWEFKWEGFLLLLILTGATLPSTIHGEVYDTEGPQFTHEPSRYNYFTNLQGLLMHCEAKGAPKPQIQWIVQKDSQAVLSYAGIREIFPNGTIYFPPFPVSFYRPDVHDQILVCIASNSVGKIRSRDVHIRAVLNQQYEVKVEDAIATEGNDALLSCIIADQVKDYVSITSWIKDTSFNIFPHSGAGGRYFMTPSGELLIEEVNKNDSSSTFRCRTVNRLTGETQLSENSARLILSSSGGSSSKSKSDSPPNIISRGTKTQLRLKEGEVAVLLCLSEGWPPPLHWWLRENTVYGGLENLRQTERIRVRKSAVIIENVGVQDSGIYICHINNTVGTARHQVIVTVTSPLSVQVVPSVLTADIGKSAEFTCWTNSPDESQSTATNRQISWRKDGIEIRTSLRLSVSVSGDKLRIANVQREDKGVYQCFLDMSSQGSAVLRLGDAAPQLVYRFIEQTLQPGPAVSLKCTATGNPAPGISWFLDGFPLPHSERKLIGQYLQNGDIVVSHLNITRTQVEDSGEVTCIAKNKLGDAKHSARLNIYGAPFVRNMPTLMTAVAGKDFKIKCPVAGWEQGGWEIRWEKDGQALPLTRRQLVSPDGTLTVKDVDRNVDSGWFSCMASSKQGATDRKGFQLSVVVQPKIVPFGFPKTNEGERIFATCVASEGDTPMRLSWLKDNQIVGDTSELSSSDLPSRTSSEISTHRIGDFQALVLQIPHVKFSDAANYSCVAENIGGRVIQTAQLVVHVPPKIAKFTLPEVSQGSRVQAVCSLEQGDTENLTVTWLKDGVPLIGGSRVANAISETESGAKPKNIKIVHVDAYSAMLIIDHVDSTHSGNYTCRISNSVQEVSSTVPLVVRVPPKWIVEPRDSEVTQGSPVVIPCKAEGIPSPTVSWKKAMGIRSENYRDIPVQSTGITNGGSISLQHQSGGSLSVISSASEDAVSLLNGTLVIRSAKKVHSGFYLCEASNDIGTGLSKKINLVVNVPVQVKEPQQNVSSRVGAKASLRCEITGDLPILEVVWKRGLNEIKDSDFRYHIRTFNNSQGMFSELTVNNVAREDTSRFVCSASNHHGRSQASIWLSVQEPPDTPHLHLISKASRFVRLGWILTQDGNSPIIQFIVKYKIEMGGTNDFHEITVPGQVFSETISNLRPFTKYLFSVAAENNVGQSENSEMLEIKTDGEAPEGTPRNVRVTAVSSSDIQVTWEHPTQLTWNGELLGYYVGYKRYREGEQYQFNTIERRDGLQEYHIKQLHAFSSYEIVVQAYNGIGTGPLSDPPVIATTLEDIPSNAPEGLHCSPLTSQNLQLGWNPLSMEQARGLIKGYKVFLERTDFDLLENDEPPLMKTTPSTNLVISGLDKFRNYSVSVQAFTTAGDGPQSSIYCHTENDLPGVPAAIKAVVSSPSSITVTWLPPREPNGILTKYTVYISTVEVKAKDAIKRKRQVQPDVTKFQFDGLRVDEKYEFRCSASTRIGEGNHVIYHRVQTKNVQPTTTSFGMEYHIVWKSDVRLPCETVGNPIVQWTRYSDTIKESDRISISGNRDGSLLIRNTRRDDGGNYTCNIIDNGNKGHVVESITHRIVVQVPPMGPLLNAAVNSHSSLNLQWKLSDSGGAAIRGYILHLKAKDEWFERQISRHLTSYELKDLECGTAYQMYLTAYNRAGMGRASEMVNVSTLGYSPSLSLVAPQFMVETNQTWARVLLRDVWSTNGCKIHSFQVLYKDHAATHWQTAGGQLTGESHSVDLLGLKGGSNYQIRVIAQSTAGSSQAEVNINTPSMGIGAETSNTMMNHAVSPPFYLDMKLMIPIFLSSVSIFVALGGVCLCFRKKTSIDCRSADRLSLGTPTSSTYFKQNQRNAQQVYMTVKKSTPMKGVDVTDLEPIPQYADDIYPYATFELNENRRDSKACGSIPTLDRRRISNQGHQWSHEAIMAQENNRLSKSKIPRGVMPMKQEESEEYDSYGSDTDTEHGPLAVPSRSPHAVGANRLNSKFQDYDSHVNRNHGNRYEFVPPTNNAMMKTRQMQNEIHGMVMADPYSFNDAYPTKTVEDRRSRSGRKSNKKRSQNHASSMIQQNQPTYSGTDYDSFVVKPHIDPPYGFKDSSDVTQKNRSSAASKEFTIAV